MYSEIMKSYTRCDLIVASSRLFKLLSWKNRTNESKRTETRHTKNEKKEGASDLHSNIFFLTHNRLAQNKLIGRKNVKERERDIRSGQNDNKRVINVSEQQE